MDGVGLLPDELVDADAFASWYVPIQTDAMSALAEVHAVVAMTVANVTSTIQAREREWRETFRFPADPGSAHLTKSATSARGKAIRDLEAGPDIERPISVPQLEKVLRGFPDLARFRIVAVFQADADQLMGALVQGGCVCGQFALVDDVKDFTRDKRRRLTAAHRARQFACVASNGIRVEIQVMTLLQEALHVRWHRVYEHRRTGGSVSEQVELGTISLAESLYMQERYSDDLWNTFLEDVEAER